MGIGNICKGLIEIIFPKVCLACAERLEEGVAQDMPVCRGCWSRIRKNVPPFCVRCGRHLEKNTITKNICPACTRKNLYFDRAFSACVYEGMLKNLIHGFKYRGKDYHGRALGELMVEHIKEYDLPIRFLDMLIPIPLHPARFREREFNQARVLAEHIGNSFGKPVYTDILIRNRPTRTQTELSPDQREANVKDSFRVRNEEQLKEKNVLLVDDVLTTGATCSEAARILKEAGARLVFVLTLAN